MSEIKQLAKDVVAGQRRALSRAITLIESVLPRHRNQAIELLQLLTPHSGGAHRIGISGVPGVGKSTYIDVLGRCILEKGHRLAVLTVDPSSSLSGGSILGDKTRMEYLAHDRRAFIRPSPSGMILGGVTRRTRESIVLCEAAGYDHVLVETVGVGQSETAVADMTDLFLLMLLPAGGDELQGMKRGIMELADIIMINKADGKLQDVANHTAADFRHALTLLQSRSVHWTVPVLTSSALSDDRVEEIFSIIEDYFRVMEKHQQLLMRRRDQALKWLWEDARNNLLEILTSNSNIQQHLQRLQSEIRTGTKIPSVAARELVKTLIGGKIE